MRIDKIICDICNNEIKRGGEYWFSIVEYSGDPGDPGKHMDTCEECSKDLGIEANYKEFGKEALDRPSR